MTLLLKINLYLKKFWIYKSLLYQLIRRDFKAKYKRSVLGILWTILNPLFTMLVLTVVFSALFRFDIENYPVYLLSGQLVFNFFAEATNLSMGSILNNAAMIKKVSIPKYIFPVSRVLSSLVNCLLSLVALFLVMCITKAPFHGTMLLSVIPIFYLTLFSIGIGLILSSLIVFFRDVGHLYGILLTAMTYLTPIFYPMSIVPDEYKGFILSNPMFYFVDYFRSVAIYGLLPTLEQNIICGSISLIALIVGLAIFYKNQDKFILYI